MNGKPRLVDYSLFPKPKPKPKIIKKPVVIKSTDNSMIINCIGLFILVIGGLCIYQRYIDRDKTELENQITIIGFNKYVKENIK